MNNKEERVFPNNYTTSSGQLIEIQPPETDPYHSEKWTVACWNEDGSNHWFLYFTEEEAARKEFERWRS